VVARVVDGDVISAVGEGDILGCSVAAMRSKVNEFLRCVSLKQQMVDNLPHIYTHSMEWHPDVTLCLY